ncbi:MAG: hypothetical protein KC656_12200, partial [Myxococcales bacterium]|nr:hypothetical protein [Myxococcales bacterium]
MMLAILGCSTPPTVATAPPVEPEPTESLATPDRVEVAPPSMAPVHLEPAGLPSSDPVDQTPRDVFDLPGGGRLVHLSRGDHWLWTVAGRTYHLEAAAPVRVTPDGIVEVGGEPCPPSGLEPATAAPFASVCPGLWRRNPVKGAKSKLEWGTDFLRDHVKGGEALTRFVKEKVVRSRGKTSEEHASTGSVAPSGSPTPVRTTRDASLVVEELGIPLSGGPSPLTAGVFYATAAQPGIWLAALHPGLVPDAGTRPLDPVEAVADTLLVLFELDRFDLHFALGTEHPRLDWADRVKPPVRTDWPGPDGFDGDGPLVRAGSVRPDRGGAVVAAFTGGFKRSHGAFHRGPLATVNRGSHYGFVEDGIVWSRPQPGLASVTVTWDGRVDLGVWTEAQRVGDYRHVRQNGLPLVVDGAIGPDVYDRLDGNWSGSVEGDARSMRAGLCIRTEGTARQLLYGYFTAATPGAMARVFLAAGCEDA